MPQKDILSGIEPDLIVDARKLRIYKDFHAQTPLGFTQYGRKKKENPASGSSLGGNRLLMKDESGQTVSVA